MLITTKTVRTSNGGARILATAPHYGRSHRTAWDHGLPSSSDLANHAAAALALCRKLNAEPVAEIRGIMDTVELVGSDGKGGYAFNAKSSDNAARGWALSAAVSE